MKTCTNRMYVGLVYLLLLAVSTAYAQKSVKQMASEAKITIDLLRIQQQSMYALSSLPPALQGTEMQVQMTKKGNSIAIEAVVTEGQDANTLLAQLQALGLTEGLYEKRVVTGFLPIDKIDELKTLSALRFARPAYKPHHNVGAVTSQGDRAMKADVARQLYNITGSGSKIGVLSDSYNSLGGAQAGVSSGDLPANVQVIDDFIDPEATDEGRAMIELIHDVAPGAAVAFNTAFKGEVAFAKGIRDLAAAGCNIIVDDVFYFADPYFQDGIIAQAVDEVKTAKKVAYFSAAGNHARNSYQSTYTNVAFTGPFGASDPYSGAHNFSSGDVYQSVTVPARSTIYVGLQWDNPFASVSGGTGAQTDMDLLVYKNGIYQASLSGTDFNIGGDAVEIAALYNPASTTATFELVVARYSGSAPSLIKWVAFTNGYTITTEYDTRSSTITGHANAAGAIATGAAYYRNTPVYNSTLTTATVETFSSAGGTPILFTTTGQRISSVTRQKPEITAVDGTNTTFFGSDRDSDGFPNFSGTSASAPHAAAVAALMQERSSNKLTPDQIVAILEQTALDMDDPLTPGFDTGFDFRTGYGFIQADRALQAISNTAPTVANTIPPQSATVNQAYTYTIPANTFTDAETPTSLTLSVTGLPPGLTFTAPSTISGTPTTTTGSPFSVTVTATDPGSLSVATTFAFTIVPATPTATAPVAPAIPNQTATVGVAFSYVVPAFSGTAPITYAASGLPAGLSFDASSRTISGTPMMAQVSTVTITGTNSAGSGNGSFTITVNAAPVGGNFAISGVTTNGCAQLTPDSRQVTFTPQYSNSDGSPISFRVVNESVPTTAPGPYSLRLYTDNPVITLEATQSGKVSTLSYNWLSACSTPPGPAAPVAPALPNQTATVGVAFSYVVPAFSGTTPITYTASGLPAGLLFDASSRTISGTPIMAQVSTVTIMGTNSAGSGNGSFTITVNAAPAGGNFAISGVITNGCAQLTANSRQVTFTPQYSNSDGSPISFRTINESVPTTAPGPYSLRLYTDNPVVTLEATQSGKVSTFSYNWLSFCNSSSRIGVAEQREPMQVRVLGNPVLSDRVELEIRGALAESVRIQATDNQGRTVHETTIRQAGEVERATVELGRSTGLYLLRVSMPGQQQVIKLIRQ